jgi:hypothetical protein
MALDSRREPAILTYGIGAGLEMEMDRTDACGGGRVFGFQKATGGSYITAQVLLIMNTLRLLNSVGWPVSIYEPLSVY